jgi:nitroreductase
MEVSKTIRERRSVRKYLPKNVPLKQILEVIDSAHYAPSSGNLQNWDFIIIQSKETKCKISEACLNQDWMIDAPVHIVICSDRERLQSFYERHKNTYSIQNCALAAQNLMLRAHSLKLGTCFVSCFSKTALKRILNIPTDPEAVITLGYPSEKPIAKRSNLENCTFFETHGNRKADKSIWPLKNTLKSLFSKFKN